MKVSQKISSRCYVSYRKSEILQNECERNFRELLIIYKIRQKIKTILIFKLLEHFQL